MTTEVVHLPLSSAAPWSGADVFRPPGWRDPRSPAQVVARLAELEAERSGSGWESATLSTAKEAARLEEHVKILRQSWVTRPNVWRLAEALIGPPEVDPFWNPWSYTHRLYSGVRLLDGLQGRDGFDLRLWGTVRGAPSAWNEDRQCFEIPPSRPRTAYVNGPHGNTAKYVGLAARAAAAGHRVAAVVALDGCNWFAGATSDGEDHSRRHADVASCDVLAVPEGGRMSFEPPPGIAESSPAKGYALALWGVPETLDLWRGRGGSRVVVDGTTWTLLRGCGDAGLVTHPLVLGTP